MRASELGLTGAAKAAAEALQKAHPGVVFTSGRRGVEDQARAMASNILRNRRWIAETYLSTSQSRELQDWLDRNPQADTAGEIVAGFTRLMSGWTDVERGRLSRHFSGEAFDVQPIAGAEGAAIKKTIRALPGLKKFLEREGGLVRWHAQF